MNQGLSALMAMMWYSAGSSGSQAAECALNTMGGHFRSLLIMTTGSSTAVELIPVRNQDGFSWKFEPMFISNLSRNPMPALAMLKLVAPAKCEDCISYLESDPSCLVFHFPSPGIAADFRIKILWPSDTASKQPRFKKELHSLKPTYRPWT